MSKLLFAILIFTCGSSFAQTVLTAEMLNAYAFRFTLDNENNFSDSARVKWEQWIGESQFVGIAEVHNSRQLSFYTTALLRLLSEKGFDRLALEIGPNSAEILNARTSLETGQPGRRIQELNRQYGKNNVYKTPIIFVNKTADTVFMNEANKLGYQFWGLDQEYAHSYLMLIDSLQALQTNPTADQKSLYKEVRNLVEKNIFKRKVKGQHVYCWYQTHPTLKAYLDGFIGIPQAEKMVADIRESWDIYCKAASGNNSNQQRANYMKRNFASYYGNEGSAPSVLVKLGGVHLTHGSSPFGVDDMGKFLHEFAAANNTGFLSIRHLITYRNGKSNMGKSGWESVEMLLRLGRKNQWTAVDLRPFRKQLQAGEITTNKQYSYELMNYDILLISPDDQYDQPNY